MLFITISTSSSKKQNFDAKDFWLFGPIEFLTKKISACKPTPFTKILGPQYQKCFSVEAFNIYPTHE